MDWTFKPSAWGFGGGGEEDDGFAGGTSRVENNNNNNAGVFSVDLKLGGSMEKSQAPKGGSSSSSSSSSKRACVVNGSGSCLVEGCTADLNSCREYYRRHRVCERHSKTPTVTVRGKQQRFCQQCSRFQSLEEFDEQKRSCRKRLDGHNRRRRKPQRRPFPLSSGSFLSNDQGGGRLLQLSGSPSYSTTSAPGSVPTWPVKHEQDHQHFSNQQTVIPDSTAATDGGGGEKTFPFLLTNDSGRSNQTVPNVPTHHHWLDTGDKVLLCSGELPDTVVNSKRALSLLSTRVISPNRPMESGGVQFDGTVEYPNTGGVPYNEAAFHVAPDDMLEEGASHVLPFSWK